METISAFLSDPPPPTVVLALTFSFSRLSYKRSILPPTPSPPTTLLIHFVGGEGEATGRGEFLSRAVFSSTAALLGVAASSGMVGVPPASALVKGNAPPPGYNKKRGSGIGNGEPGEHVGYVWGLGVFGCKPSPFERVDEAKVVVRQVQVWVQAISVLRDELMRLQQWYGRFVILSYISINRDLCGRMDILDGEFSPAFLPFCLVYQVSCFCITGVDVFTVP